MPIVFVVAYNRLVQAAYKSWKYHALGIFLMLAISFSWFVVLYKEDHAFADYFIFKHTIDRFATNTFGRRQPFWFYLVIVPLTSLPWAFIVLRALSRLRLKAYSVDSVLLIWIFLPLIFFSLSTSKLILYVLPIYGGIALLAAHSWERVKNKLRWDAGFLIFTGIVALALGLMPLFDHSLVYGFLWFCSIGLLMMVSIILYVRIKSESPDRLLIYLSVVFTSSLTVLASIFFHNNPAKVHDQRNVAAFIKDIPDVEKIYVYNERLPSLAFNLDRSIISIADGDSDLDREIQFERNQKWERLLIKPWDLQPADTEQSVFVAKVNHGINEYFKDSFVAAYQNSHVVDGWVIYY
ncbi:hypothetical protein [Fulvivirga ligni]|uniref:hypothetical protein n=1 Tax=Fulvivirga ligni TaxID=2904246 RepID=UPI001F175162|nr:hypothetical protein [Fulvivirga ligni]UII21273.1 hypothetical protein LVD16_25915 [Fulvivirga ligni]